MLTMKKVALLTGLCICVSATARAEPVNLMSAPFGSGTYVLSNALEQISKKANTGIEIVAQESPGFIFNTKKMEADVESRKTTIFGTGRVTAQLASEGKAPFTEKYTQPLLIANFTVSMNWLATTDPNIKKVSDLAGKSIALGRTTQINWAIEPITVIEKGWGIPLDKFNIQYLGTKPAATALLDGKVDAAVVGGYANISMNKVSLSPQTLELVSSGRQIYHLPWTEVAVRKTMEAGMPVTPFTIPAGSFEGLTNDLEVVADTGAWVAMPEFPEDKAYKITKLIIDHLGEFGEYGASGKLMSREGLLFGWSQENIHPGALRAYKEAGLIK